jgi:hypothetical protein
MYTSICHGTISAQVTEQYLSQHISPNIILAYVTEQYLSQHVTEQYFSQHVTKQYISVRRGTVSQHMTDMSLNNNSVSTYHGTISVAKFS